MPSIDFEKIKELYPLPAIPDKSKPNLAQSEYRVEGKVLYYVAPAENSQKKVRAVYSRKIDGYIRSIFSNGVYNFSTRRLYLPECELRRLNIYIMNKSEWDYAISDADNQLRLINLTDPDNRLMPLVSKRVPSSKFYVSQIPD